MRAFRVVFLNIVCELGFFLGPLLISVHLPLSPYLHHFCAAWAGTAATNKTRPSSGGKCESVTVQNVLPLDPTTAILLYEVGLTVEETGPGGGGEQKERCPRGHTEDEDGGGEELPHGGRSQKCLPWSGGPRGSSERVAGLQGSGETVLFLATPEDSVLVV